MKSWWWLVALGALGACGQGLIEQRRSGSRLRAAYYTTGPGGVRVPWSFYDALLDTECAIGPDGAGALRCVPFSASIAASGFADAACSQPAVALLDEPCGSPTPWPRHFSVVSMQVGCAQTLDV